MGIKQARYPSRDYVPFFGQGNALAVNPGEQRTVFRLNPKPGMARLRLTHCSLFSLDISTAKFTIVSNIPGLNDLQSIHGIADQTLIMPLFYTIPGQAQGTIDVINNAAAARDFHFTFQGWYEQSENNVDLEKDTEWLKYLMPEPKSLQFAQRCNPANFTFIAPFIGDLIRVYCLQGFETSFALKGPGINHYDGDQTTKLWNDNEGQWPLLGHLIPGQQYTVITSQEATLYGWSVKWKS